MTLWTAIALALVLVAVGLAAWAMLADPARGRLRCPGGWRRLLGVIPFRRGCWYDMSGVVSPGGSEAPCADAPAGSVETAGVRLPATCPECGRVCRGLADLRRRRVWYRVLLLTLPVLLGAHVASLMPRVEKHGWWSAAPTWALVVTVPLDEFARGALGCPISWNQMPQQTRELLYPAWNRPVSAWESAILKARVDAAASRVAWEFPGREVATVTMGRYGRGDWWGWIGRPLTRQERQMMARDAVSQARVLEFDDDALADSRNVIEGDATQGGGTPPASPERRGHRMAVQLDPTLVRSVETAGLLVLGASRERVGSLRSAMARLESLSLSPGECRVLAENDALALIAMDIAPISPRRFIAITADDAAAEGLAAGSVGSPRVDPVTRDLALALRRLNPEGRLAHARTTPQGQGARTGPVHESVPGVGLGTPRSGVLAGVVRRSDVEPMSRVVRALNDAWPRPGFVSEIIPVGDGGVSARVYNLAELAGQDLSAGLAVSRRTPAVIARARDLIVSSMGGQGALGLRTVGDAIAVRHLVLVIGTDEQQESARQQVERMMPGTRAGHTPSDVTPP